MEIRIPESWKLVGESFILYIYYYYTFSSLYYRAALTFFYYTRSYFVFPAEIPSFLLYYNDYYSAWPKRLAKWCLKNCKKIKKIILPTEKKDFKVKNLFLCDLLSFLQDKQCSDEKNCPDQNMWKKADPIFTYRQFWLANCRKKLKTNFVKKYICKTGLCLKKKSVNVYCKILQLFTIIEAIKRISFPSFFPDKKQCFCPRINQFGSSFIPIFTAF